jgi:ribose-phosphate pyrophosphokinase
MLFTTSGEDRMIVVGGSASQNLSASLSKATGAKLAKVEIKRFPDGECYVRIDEDLKGQQVVVVQTTYPDPNLVELFILLDAARDMAPAKLTTVVPYFGYARQDKRFKNGEAISARAFVKLINNCTDEFVSVDIHAPKILDNFTIPHTNVSVMKAFGEFFKDKGVDLVLAPDKGALDRANTVAKVLGCPWDHLEKTRIDGSTVKMAPKAIDAKGKVVAIVDDIIATGGTIIKATEALKAQGALKVFAACAHGLYTSNALDRLTPVCDAVYSADTLENPTSHVSAAGVLAEHFQKKR